MCLADDRTEERSREGPEPGKVEVVEEEVVGADEDSVEEGTGEGGGTAAAEDGVAVELRPPSRTRTRTNTTPYDTKANAPG